MAVRSRIGAFLAALAMLALAGCSHVEFIPETRADYRPWYGLVQVTDRFPERYVRIGTVIAHGVAGDTDASLIEFLKERAAAAGANIIVVSSGRVVSGRSLVLTPEYEMTAVAIRNVR
ncbi:MAG TPA: hypothetical protein VFC38_09720 [Stellaceae bacterium]|nr:hypothetical protein [Stellaceae bacterium]